MLPSISPSVIGAQGSKNNAESKRYQVRHWCAGSGNRREEEARWWIEHPTNSLEGLFTTSLSQSLKESHDEGCEAHGHMIRVTVVYAR